MEKREAVSSIMVLHEKILEETNEYKHGKEEEALCNINGLILAAIAVEDYL